MQCYTTFEDLEGETVLAVRRFQVAIEAMDSTYSFRLILTKHHGVLVFDLNREDRFFHQNDYPISNGYERYFFLKDKDVQHFLQNCGVPYPEIHAFLTKQEHTHRKELDYLIHVQRKIRNLAAVENQLADDWA